MRLRDTKRLDWSDSQRDWSINPQLSYDLLCQQWNAN
jgi:hypothetical protein